jgi:hypothetical protein
MPRGRCHFALLLALQDRLDEGLPGAGDLVHRHFPDFLAGSLAPDAMRSLGKLGKFDSHFYEENKRETWGKSVSGLFEAHPGLSNPDLLTGQDRAFLMGYISHLTTDEAFRDEVTIHVHGIENWRPIIRGLWSRIDELPIAHPDLGGEIDQFNRSDQLGFIDCKISRIFLNRARGWAVETDPWLHEKVFLNMIGREISEKEDRAKFSENRRLADPFLSEDRRVGFVTDALKRGFDEVQRFIEGTYARIAE